jgi:hypothetical protein
LKALYELGIRKPKGEIIPAKERALKDIPDEYWQAPEVRENK